MDFIKSQELWVVVDRFNKYAHFRAPHPISAKTLAFIGYMVFHASDRDSLFLSEFWQSLFKIYGTRLCMNSAYNPQSDVALNE